jgi:hypothetical protein
MLTRRPNGPGLYSTISLGAHRWLTMTHRDRDALPAQPDPCPLPISQRTAEAIMRKARNLGASPTEAVRRLLDTECAKAARRSRT